MRNREELIHIFTSSNIEVDFVRSQLEAYGIECLTKRQYQKGLNEGFVGEILDSYDIYVRADDFEKAIQIIHDLGMKSK